METLTAASETQTRCEQEEEAKMENQIQRRYHTDTHSPSMAIFCVLWHNNRWVSSLKQAVISKLLLFEWNISVVQVFMPAASHSCWILCCRAASPKQVTFRRNQRIQSKKSLKNFFINKANMIFNKKLYLTPCYLTLSFTFNQK